MKKSHYIFILFIITSTLQAQNINWGLKGGVNISDLNSESFKGIIDTKKITSFHFGAMLEAHITEKLSLQPELTYSAQGTSTKTDKTKLNYILIPLMAKYYLVEGLNIQAGPQLGINVLNKRTITNSDGTTNEIDQTEHTNTIDFSANFGAGYKLKNGLNFSVRYNLGMTDIVKENNFKPLKNEVFQISVGYFFK